MTSGNAEKDLGFNNGLEAAAKIIENYVHNSSCCGEEGSKRGMKGFCEGFGHSSLYRLADEIRARKTSNPDPQGPVEFDSSEDGP